MKTTLQQAEILKSYLANVLKYSETIDEVYDHVLTAVEEKPENVKFQDAVNQILNDDFKGGKGLVKMERQRLRTATWEGFIQIVRYIKADFRFPNIFHIILLFGAIDYAISYLNISVSQFVLFYPITAGVYCILIWTRKFFVGYYKGDTRTSINDFIVIRIGYPCNYIFMILMMLSSFKPNLMRFIVNDHPEIIAVILTAYYLYVYSVIRICRNEFKPYFSK